MPKIITKYGAAYLRTEFNDRHVEETYLSGIPSGDFADRPDAGDLTTFDAGLLYCAADEDKLYKWSGSAWELILEGGGGGGVTLPIEESDVNGLVDDLDQLFGSSAYTVATYSALRSLDGTTGTLQDALNTLCTLIADLQSKGILS